METNHILNEQDINAVKSYFTDNGNYELVAFGYKADPKNEEKIEFMGIIKHEHGLIEENLTCYLKLDEPKSNWYFNYNKTRLHAGVSCSGGFSGDIKDAQSYIDSQLEKYFEPSYYYCYRGAFAYADYDCVSKETAEQYQKEIDAGTRTGFITTSFTEASQYAND